VQGFPDLRPLRAELPADVTALVRRATAMNPDLLTYPTPNLSAFSAALGDWATA
jgi:hypothetical protein